MSHVAPVEGSANGRLVIDLTMHHEVMFGLIFISLIVVLAPLAYFAGADSRVDDVARRRRYSG